MSFCSNIFYYNATVYLSRDKLKSAMVSLKLQLNPNAIIPMTKQNDLLGILIAVADGKGN